MDERSGGEAKGTRESKRQRKSKRGFGTKVVSCGRKREGLYLRGFAGDEREGGDQKCGCEGVVCVFVWW